MKCRFCQAEMEEGTTLCPSCGKDNSVRDMAEPEQVSEQVPEQETPVQEPEQDPAPKKKISAGKLAVIYGLILAVLAVGVAFVLHRLNRDDYEAPSQDPASDVTVPEDGNRDDVTCQGSYTVSDKKAYSQRKKVIATIGDAELTNTELQVYYWMQVLNYDASASGQRPDYTKPLDSQMCPMEEGLTWQQFFLKNALTNWQMYHAFCQEAEHEKFVFGEDILNILGGLEKNMEEVAAKNGLKDKLELVQHDMGPGSTVEAYLAYSDLYYKGFSYYDDLISDIQATEEQIRAHFEEHREEYKENGVEDDGSVLVDVRHILVEPADAKSDASWAEAEKKAQEVLAQWEKDGGTEDAFAALAAKHSSDPGSKDNGGLYVNVSQGQMVESFDKWCFDKARKSGDSGLVKTEFGYHVMFFSDSRPVWYALSREGAKAKLVNELIDGMLEKYPITVKYSRIVLGNVNLAG